LPGPLPSRGHHPWRFAGYLRFGLSYRDVEELLPERGVDVDHVGCICGSSGLLPSSPRRESEAAHRGDRWHVNLPEDRRDLAVPVSCDRSVRVGH
jgi:hypothetical protein